MLFYCRLMKKQYAMKKKNFFILICTLLMVTACGPSIYTEKTADVDLSEYETFAYLPNTNADVEGISFDEGNVDPTVIKTINLNLKQEGYTLDRQNPDLLVLVATQKETEVATTTEPVYASFPYATPGVSVSPFYDPFYYEGFYDYSNFVGYDMDSYAYKEGSLVVYLVDRETKETVWKGVAVEDIYRKPTPAAIEKMVNELFENFPGV